MDPVTLWIWSLAAGGVVIIVVALLLLAIIATARRIDHHAQEIWTVGKNIAGNTVSIWLLNRTNQTAAKILATTESIDANLKALAAKLEGEKQP